MITHSRWRYAPPVLSCLLVAGLALFATAPLYALPFVVAVGATETTANLDALMKITFDDTLISEVVTDTELMDWFPKGEAKRGPEGRYFETSQLYQNPGSVGSRSENGYIPIPNGAKAANGRVSLKKIMGAIEETAEVLKKIRGDKVAFVNWAKEQFPRFRENLSDEMDRMVLGDGSGIRARVNAATPAVTLVVDSTLGIAGLGRSLLQFRRGMFLRASPNANGSTPRAGTMMVTEINWASNAIVVDPLATGLADNDYLFEGDAADNSAGKDQMGLFGLVDDGGIVSTLQNISRTTNLWFRSYVHNGAAAVIDETMLIEADRIARLRGGGKVDAIVMSEEAFNAVWATLKVDRQINDPRSYTGGRKGIDILFGATRRVNLRTARKLPETVVFGLQKDQIRTFTLHDWEWDDTTGAIWKQVVDSTGRKDAFYAYGSAYGELAIKSPQRCWRLEGFALA